MKNLTFETQNPDPDWAAIKAEYITGSASLRELAEKHKVSFTTLSRRCAAGKWVEARRKVDDDATTEIARNTARKNSSVRNELYTVAEKVLKKIGFVVDGITVDDSDDIKSIKLITGALKDLKDVLDVRSTADAKEQRERIKRLQRETAAASASIADGGVTVSFEGEEADEWSG